MSLRYLTPPLAVLALSLGLLSCSKDKDEPSPDNSSPAAGTGRYTLDGKVYQGEAHSLTYSLVTDDYLRIEILPNPQPAGTRESILITYKKAKSQAVSSYRADRIEYLLGGDLLTFSTSPSTLDITPSGGFTGKFSSTSLPFGYTLTDGAFTNVRP